MAFPPVSVVQEDCVLTTTKDSAHGNRADLHIPVHHASSQVMKRPDAKINRVQVKEKRSISSQNQLQGQLLAALEVNRRSQVPLLFRSFEVATALSKSER